MARLRNRIETATAWLAFPVILLASLFATMVEGEEEGRGGFGDWFE